MSVLSKNEKLKNRPIGFMDSGVGGLSVLREAVRVLPNEDFIYFGDSANAPYGTRTVREIRELTFKAVEKLMEYDIKALVVACNTATSAAISELRSKYKDMPVIGIEPAVKPAVVCSNGGRIIVMATPMTLRQRKFRELIKTYENEEWVMQAMEAQGFEKDSDDVYQIPRNGISMRIPAALIPKCPDDGSDVTMNLRADDSFVEDEGWYKASGAYADFIHRHENLRTLYLEIGVGANTPVIIKYPFWAMTRANPDARYACLNFNEAFCPKQIEKQSICINGDAGELIEALV